MIRAQLLTRLAPAALLVTLPAALLAAAAAGPAAAQEPPDHVPGEVLVCFAPGLGPGPIAALEARFGLLPLHEIPHLRLRHYRLPAGLGTEAAVQALAIQPGVDFVEPNRVHRLEAIPTDPRFAEQWSLHNTGQIVQGETGPADADIDWPEAIDLHQAQAEVVVAVIDSGVALDHPDLVDNVWTNDDDLVDGVDNDANGFVDDTFGWDFFDNDALPLDENGHGTLVASQIAAGLEDGVGGVGVAPGARIMALRAFDDFGSGGAGSTLNFLLATTYAADQGARIINYSAGRVGGFSQSEYAQLLWLDGQGILLVAAAGNGGIDGVGDDNDALPHYPSSYAAPNVIAVAATDRTDALAAFSNQGLVSVDLAAPGEVIFGADVNRSTTYLETFDTGAPGWTVGKSCGLCDDWTLFDGAGGNTWANDSEDQLTGDPLVYLPFADAWTDSPWIPLPLVGPQLSFRTWFEIEAFDLFLVEMTTDGLFWDVLDFVQGPRFTLTEPPWASAGAGVVPAYDLSLYAGQTVKLRFRIVTDGLYEADGVYVDDVTLSQVDTFVFDGTQFQFRDGTSFAAPLTAGVAALLMSQRPELGHLAVRDAILQSVDPLPALSGAVATGGRLNAHSALQAVPEPTAPGALLAGVLTLLALRRPLTPRGRPSPCTGGRRPAGRAPRR